jgi:hypothetical protein
MLAMSRSGMPWQSIGGLYGINKGSAWKIANTDWEPKSLHLRQLLGLPLRATVTPVNGNLIPEGTQVYNAIPCINNKCGHKSFSPNTSKRRQCYTCQKARERKP